MAKVTITIQTEVADDLDSLVALKRKVAKLEKVFGADNVRTQTQAADA